jgi:hypothetical protein
LCEACNNKTNEWYVAAYAEWARQAARSLAKTQNDSGDITFTIQPLNVLKQVAVGALAMVADPNADVAVVKPEVAKHWALRNFVLDPTSKDLPRQYAFYSYRTKGFRFERLITKVDTETGEWTQILAEIARPPLGHCVVGQRSLFPLQTIAKRQLCSIDWFTYYDFNETATIPLRLPIKHVSTYFHLDYRTEEEVSSSVARQEIVELLRSRYKLG